ncbi:MAG TPA: alginate export family protein [Candidatus Acidoferrum sp.]|nr:alginate export family protein [Candidatus Acidoferrum sp.]
MQRVEVMPIKTMKEATAKLKDEMVRLARFAVRTTGYSLRQASLARIARVVGLLVLGAGVPASAQTPETTETATPEQSTCPRPAPAFTQLTYDEDNRYFSNPNCRTEFLDRLKFIPLRGDDENYYLSLGIFTRDRGEYFSHPDLGRAPEGNAYLMQRYFLHMDLHLGERFRFFGELASSLITGRNGGPRAGLDEKQLYVHQGFFDLGLWQSGKDSLILRAGRQEMVLGSENFVSTRDGRNIRRSLNGFRLTWVKGDWTIDTFALRPTLDVPGNFNDPPNHASSFWGAYAVRPFAFLPEGNVDLYYFGLDLQRVPFDGKGFGREQRETIGTRLWGTTEHWDYNDEFTYQWGWFGPVDVIRAWAISTETAYRIDSNSLKPRFALRAISLSGDQNPSSRTLGTFNSIFEKGPYFSYAEVFARRNLIALQPYVELHLSKTVTLTPNPAFFWRESPRDGLYTVGNAVLISGQNSNARYIASQASAQVRWKMNRNLTWFTEYGHFFPGEFLKQAASGTNLNFWTGWLDIRY